MLSNRDGECTRKKSKSDRGKTVLSTHTFTILCQSLAIVVLSCLAEDAYFFFVVKHIRILSEVFVSLPQSFLWSCFIHWQNLFPVRQSSELVHNQWPLFSEYTRYDKIGKKKKRKEKTISAGAKTKEDTLHIRVSHEPAAFGFSAKREWKLNFGEIEGLWSRTQVWMVRFDQLARDCFTASALAHWLRFDAKCQNLFWCVLLSGGCIFVQLTTRFLVQETTAAGLAPWFDHTYDTTFPVSNSFLWRIFWNVLRYFKGSNSQILVVPPREPGFVVDATTLPSFLKNNNAHEQECFRKHAPIVLSEDDRIGYYPQTFRIVFTSARTREKAYMHMTTFNFSVCTTTYIVCGAIFCWFYSHWLLKKQSTRTKEHVSSNKSDDIDRHKLNDRQAVVKLKGKLSCVYRLMQPNGTLKLLYLIRLFLFLFLF